MSRTQQKKKNWMLLLWRGCKNFDLHLAGLLPLLLLLPLVLLPTCWSERAAMLWGAWRRGSPCRALSHLPGTKSCQQPCEWAWNWILPYQALRWLHSNSCHYPPHTHTCTCVDAQIIIHTHILLSIFIVSILLVLSYNWQCRRAFSEGLRWFCIGNLLPLYLGAVLEIFFLFQYHLLGKAV